MPETHFEPEQLADLCRVNRQGMEKAALSLSKLLRKNISIEVAESWLSRRALASLNQSEQTLGIFIHVSGPLRGSLLLVLEAEAANWLCQQLLGTENETDLLQEPASSMLKEVANIMASTFLASLDDRLGLRLLPEPPKLFAKSLAAMVRDYQGQQDEPCLIAQTLIIAEEAAEPFRAAVYLLPDQTTLEALVQRASNK